MSEIIFGEVPVDEGGYPTWQWPDKADQLLFDVGYSYALLRRAETVLAGLDTALGEHETAQPESSALEANRALHGMVGELLAKMRNFRGKRLNDRDAIYEAGYAAGARLESKLGQK